MAERDSLDSQLYEVIPVAIPLYGGWSSSGRREVSYQIEEGIRLKGEVPLQDALSDPYISGGRKLIAYATTEGHAEEPSQTVRITLAERDVAYPTLFTEDGDDRGPVNRERLNWRRGQLLTIPLEGQQDISTGQVVSEIIIRTGRLLQEGFFTEEEFVRPSGINAVPLKFAENFSAARRRRFSSPDKI